MTQMFDENVQIEPADVGGLDFSRTPVVLVGHSHVYSLVGFDNPAVGFAIASEFRVDPVEGARGLRVCHGAWPRTAEYWDDLYSLSQTSEDFSIAISFRGNDHLARFLIRPTAPIDFFSTELPTLPIDPAAQIVPESLVEALFSPDYEALRTIIRRLAAGGRRVILIGTPPPKANNEFLRNVISNEAYFVQVCNYLGVSPDSVAFTPSTVRLKLWGLLQSITKRIAADEGAEYLPVPEMARDVDGSLRREFWSADCTHANCEFGRLILKDLLGYLNRLEA